jgi:hypothetical protein
MTTLTVPDPETLTEGWINNYRLWNWLMSFGGYKDSGYGREGGLEVMQHYTQTRAVWVDLREDPDDWFGDGGGR